MQKNLYGMLKLAKMQQKAYENAIPIHATFEITPRCGFNCRMCYVHLPVDRISKVGDGRELTGDEWLSRLNGRFFHLYNWGGPSVPSRF